MLTSFVTWDTAWGWRDTLGSARGVSLSSLEAQTHSCRPKAPLPTTSLSLPTDPELQLQ